MSDISIKVNVAAGAVVYDTIFDMCRMANILNANVDATMNGIYFRVGPNHSPKKEYKRWLNEIELQKERLNTER